MIYRIEVGYKKNILDALGESVNKDINDLGIKEVSKVKSVQIYKLDADLNFAQIDEICRKLLTDPITQEYRVNQPLEHDRSQRHILVEVWFKKGVTDAVGDTVITGTRDLNVQGTINSAHTGAKYVLYGRQLTRQQAEMIARKLLSNNIVQDYYLEQEKPS
jgi:phosphoribosylformylglycinamidine (FGAM) synthase PurS component